MQLKNRQFVRACGLIACAGALLAAVPAAAVVTSTIKAKAKKLTLTECAPVYVSTANPKPHKDCAPTVLRDPSEAVATFKDSNLASGPADYVVKISWGDGDVSAGAVRGNHGKFTVFGQHEYSGAGTYATEIAVVDQLNDAFADVFGQLKVKFKHPL